MVPRLVCGLTSGPKVSCFLVREPSSKFNFENKSAHPQYVDNLSLSWAIMLEKIVQRGKLEGISHPISL